MEHLYWDLGSCAGGARFEVELRGSTAPNTLAKAYSDAGYFARNVRAIEVLVDRDAVTSGAAANGQPWQYYDLGHGHCAYTFSEQMSTSEACARCDFYTPKNSSKGHARHHAPQQ